MDAGKRIKERLVELKCEYDEKIRQCADIIDGMVLVAQLEWNTIGQNDTQTNLIISRTNNAIAEATQADSKRMRSISTLTMVFLPATFVATVFSMTLFNWSPEQDQEVMSPWFWVYAVITIALTLLTWGAWLFYNRRMARSKHHDVESGSISSAGTTSEKGCEHVQASTV
ncbi:hypothetical protein INS49_007286 [Diaporthe citri]|uniref:uncharacterized protein n=1 Tax=Diaporthe citri TaxID=83186 RepID=UPI001C7FB976|nr:uncharacterized protein INS49_007286 [Diaporthe citri]KAG6365675.1 hypothetical protein INS49_007286 [Diaporthe citri]